MHYVFLLAQPLEKDHLQIDDFTLWYAGCRAKLVEATAGIRCPGRPRHFYWGMRRLR